jgi:two-component system chemotaxis response regulator CheB
LGRGRPRRIVVCDRDATRVESLRRFLEHDSEIEIAGVFDDLEAMLSQLTEIAPALIVLDLEATGTGTGNAIESIMRQRATPILLLLAGAAAEEDGRLGEALKAGALEAIPEEKLNLEQPEGIWATALRSRVKRLASISLKRRIGSGPHGSEPPPPSRIRSRPGATYRAIGIGASVGGPPALAEVLGALPADFPLPVLVVQHMAPGFGGGLARWLDRSVQLPVAVAADGDALRPGAWMAPEDAHLRLDQAMRLSLDRETERGAHRPSLDVLFESLAAAAGDGAVGVVLTGMGRDGADGVRAIRAGGGLTVAQDEETSAVFGMPQAAIEAGAELVLPLEQLASQLARLPVRSAAP